MIIEKIGNDRRTKLQMTLEKLTSSFSKRGVAFVITAHSEYVGQIIILVTGKKGTVQKTLVVIYNQKSLYWEAYNDGYVFHMDSISEISTIIKSKINNLSALLLKV